MSETVKVRVSISIESEGDYDTDMTVEQWNALSGIERSKIAQDMWQTEAENDNGGYMVLTEGAERL